MTERAPDPHGHAVVIGASIAGMVAARVLAEQFEKVTVIERDALPDEPVDRQGVPQGSHPHTLLVRGRTILEELFPGIIQELLDQTAIWFDYGHDAHLSIYGNRLPRFNAGVATVSCSRALLEWRVRQRLRATPRVEIRDGTQVTSLLAEGATCVRGVRIRARGQDEAHHEQLPADLVVNAGGRGTKMLQWLNAMGIERIPETTIQPGVGYSTRWYRVPEDRFGDWSAIGISTEFPHQTGGAAVVKVEGGRMLVTLVGTAKQYPPADEDGFIKFASRLSEPLIAEIVTTAEALSPIFKFRGGDDIFRHYEKVKAWPERLVVLGDAVCVFNPVYAQGMAVAAMSALLLGAHVRHHRRGRPDGDLDGLSRPFQRKLARMCKTPWRMAIAEDARWEAQALGKTGWSERFNFWLQKQVLRSVTSTEEGTRKMLQVMHMQRSALALVTPGVLARVAGRALAGLVRRDESSAKAPALPPPSAESP